MKNNYQIVVVVGFFLVLAVGTIALWVYFQSTQRELWADVVYGMPTSTPVPLDCKNLKWIEPRTTPLDLELSLKSVLTKRGEEIFFSDFSGLQHELTGSDKKTTEVGDYIIIYYSAQQHVLSGDEILFFNPVQICRSAD